jgi:predicted transcriptional regulator
MARIRVTLRIMTSPFNGLALPLSLALMTYPKKKEPQLMEVHFPPETEAKLTHSAAQQGRAPDEIAQEIVTRYFEEETRLVEAVKRGEDALQRGEYLTHGQVGQRLQRFLQS